MRLGLQIIFLIGILILVGCTQQYVCADGTVVSKPALCPRQEAPFEPTATVISIPQQTLPAEIQNLLTKSNAVKTMKYDFKEVHKPLETAYTTWVGEEKVKRELPIIESPLHTNEIDVVIFDIVQKTALGYCESPTYCQRVGEIKTVDYDQYYENTPFDWLKLIVSAEKIGKETLFKREVWKLNVNNNVTMWIDTYYGMPLKVEVNGKGYEFRDPVFNSVREEDVAFRALEE